MVFKWMVAAGMLAACPDSVKVHGFFAQYRADLPPDLAFARGALVVVCGKRTTFAEGFGRTVAGDSVNPNQTIFRAASNSKLIVATAVMQLADRGLWSVNDDVNRYLPPASRLEPLRRTRPVAIAHLLTHTAAGNRGQLLERGSRAGWLSRRSSLRRSIRRVRKAAHLRATRHDALEL